MSHLPAMPALDDPLLGFRFGVFFMGKAGIGHPLDFRFQQVNGISQSVEVGLLSESSQNVSTQRFPKKLNTGELELIRGMPLISTLRKEILESFNDFKFKPRNVLVSILDENALPVSSWLFSEAYPIQWSISQLNASSNEVIIENMKLTYKSLKPFNL